MKKTLKKSYPKRDARNVAIPLEENHIILLVLIVSMMVSQYQLVKPMSSVHIVIIRYVIGSILEQFRNDY